MLKVPDFSTTVKVKGYAVGSDGADILLDTAVLDIHIKGKLSMRTRHVSSR